MLQSSQVIITEKDNTDQVVGAVFGIAGLEGVTRRGPVNRPDILITSLPQFRKIYGGIIPTSDFPFQVEKILKAGGQLRINGIRHYTTITDKTTLSALVAALAAPIKDATPVNLFNASAKYPGADYNAVTLTIAPASNGKANYFDLNIVLTTDAGNATEKYPNLITTNTTVGNSHYLDYINTNSNLVVMSYLDLSALGAQTRPVNGTFSLAGGSDGGAVVPADYIGDTGAKTGLYAFDGFSDMTDIAIPVISDATVNSALALYADARGDIQALIHLGNTNATAAALVAARGAYDTKYAGIFAGGIQKTDASTGNQTTYSEIADIININNYVDKTFAPWASRAGTQKGVIKDASGVVNNFGGPGSLGDLNLLSGNQINMVINKDGKVYLKGNFSGQINQTKASFFNIVRGLIYLKKSLRPTLEKYLEEPADIPTFIKLYKEVEPFLDKLTSGRFFYKGAGVSQKGYDWKGDQDASDINHLTVNTPADLNNGIYNIQLDIYPINAIQAINLVIGINSIAQSIDITANFNNL